MPRPINRLTARTVATAGLGRHADGLGLYLLNDGTKRWIFHFMWAGSRREMGLGSAAEVGLAEARRQRDEARELVRQGRNPIDGRKAAKAGTIEKTFGDVASEVMASKGGAWLGSKASAPMRRTFEAVNDGPGYAAPLLKLKPQQVDTAAVLRVLKPIWLSKPETAGKVQRHIEQVIDTATAQGLRVGDNPARWRHHLDKLLPARPALTRGHQRALPYEAMPEAWKQIRASDSAGALALAYTILTAARESQTLGATWAEIDLGAKLWTIPKNRMKGRADQRREHVVPLSDAAVEVLRIAGTQDYGALLFPSPLTGGELSNSTMDAVCDRLGLDATPHGFRSTFRDWAGDCTDHPEEVAEMALAHVVGSKTARAYRRRDALEKRRRLLDDWAAYVTGTEAPRVISLRPPA